jgi:hypothetical protein
LVVCTCQHIHITQEQHMRVKPPTLDGRPVAMWEIQDILGVSTLEEAELRFQRCKTIYGTVTTGRLLQTKPPLVLPAYTKGTKNTLPMWLQQVARRGLTKGAVHASMDHGYTVEEINLLMAIMTGEVTQ